MIVIDTSVWIEAGDYSSENKLFSKGIGLIDCAIIVSARKHQAKVWSLDKKLNNILEEDEVKGVVSYHQGHDLPAGACRNVSRFKWENFGEILHAAYFPICSGIMGDLGTTLTINSIP